MTVDQMTGKLHERAIPARSCVRLDDAPSRSLQADVEAALVCSGYAGLAGVGCEVNGERVVLFGAVPTYHLKQLAQVFAQRVDGVGKVVNRIAVFA